MTNQMTMREQYVQDHTAVWIERGASFKEHRVQMSLTISEVANAIGISASTLSRFERGYPISRPNVIERAYEMYLLLRSAPCEYIGDVMVDSGQLLLTDPCHLKKWKHGEYHPGATNSYAEACENSLSDSGYGEVLGGVSLSLRSGWGDGVYPVYVKRDNYGRIEKLEIDMSPFSELEQ